MYYLLDADWIINSIGGHRGASQAIQQLSPRGIAVSWITVGEVGEVAFNSPNPQAYLASLYQFLSPFYVLNVNREIMERFGEIRSTLRRAGSVIADFDILLGATALHHNLTVLTFNVRHLDRIAGLRIYQYP